MKKILIVLSVMALFLGSIAATNANAKELKWVGCGIVKKAFMNELAEAYEKKTGTKIVIRGGGSTKGIRAVAAGLADLGGTCRHKIDVGVEKAAKLHHVAWDALVIIVNRDNPIDSITVAQIKDVFAGKIMNWKDLGGQDAAINLYVRRGKISGVGLMAREILFDNPVFGFSPDAKIMRSTGPLERAIAKDAQGIGISGISSAIRDAGLKMLKVDGVSPTKENIMKGKYPLYRPLYLTTKGEPTGEIKNFIDFAKSDEGQLIISKQGTVNLEEGKALSMD